MRWEKQELDDFEDRYRCVNNIRMDCKDIGFSQVDLIEVTQNRVQLTLDWNATEVHGSALLQVR